MRRALLLYLGFGLGGLMIIAGVATILGALIDPTIEPRAELATGGATLVLATGLVGSNNGNGNGRRK